MYLGDEYINSRTLSDVTFSVQGRPFFAHRIALLASSDAFRAMFGGGYREEAAASIEIPNIEYDVFEVMMRYIYTGQVCAMGGGGLGGGVRGWGRGASGRRRPRPRLRGAGGAAACASSTRVPSQLQAQARAKDRRADT